MADLKERITDVLMAADERTLEEDRWWYLDVADDVLDAFGAFCSACGCTLAATSEECVGGPAHPHVFSFAVWPKRPVDSAARDLVRDPEDPHEAGATPVVDQ